MKMKSAAFHSAAAVLLLSSGAVLADPDVYGKINVDLQSADEAGESQVELKSNASRFGVKGDEDLGEGLKAIYQFEWEIDPTDAAKSSQDHIKSRNQFIGLQGAFGTLKLGRSDTALKQSQGDFDLFNDLEGDIKHVVNGENRVNNYIGYTTPSFGDFSVTVNLVPGEDAAAGEDGVADATSISLNYEADAFYAALAQDTDIDGTDVDTTRATGGYKFGDAVVNVLYQTTDTGAADADAVGVSFGYKFGDNMFRVQHLDGDIWQLGGATYETSSSIGFDHKFSKATKVYGFYTTADIGGTDQSNDYFGVGLEHKF